MNDIQLDLIAIREHLDAIEAKLKATRRPGYNGNYGAYRNTDTNGNYTTDEWNDKIKEDR